MRLSRLCVRVERQVWLRAGAALLVAVGLLVPWLRPRPFVVAGGQAQEGPTTLCGGECMHETITFETEEDTGAQSIDVLFLLDVTSSMDAVLREVQEQSIEIMDDLRASVPDSAFAAASFADYNEFYDSQYGGPYGVDDDYPYLLHQDVTEDTSAVQDALNGISLMNGGDGPESYNRALDEARALDWRDARRLVVLFGDAIPHERDFFPGNDYGIDPGRDEIEGTEDDLFLEEVVQRLVDARITVIGVNSDVYDLDEVTSFFQYVSEQTGGLYFRLDEANDIPSAVVRLVEEEISTINRLTVRATEGYQDWIASEPEAYTDVAPATAVSFEVDICPPADARAGLHEFELILDGDGVALQTMPISIDYTPRCVSRSEVYVGDRPGDDGSVCSNPNGEPYWVSEDIVVRHAEDAIYYHQNPIRGQTNYVYARVHNIGDQDADQVQVTLYWANAALGLFWPGHWNRLGSTTVDVPAGGSVWTEAIPWDPPGSRGEDHFCLFARIESDEDPITHEGDVPCDNNIAQRNLHVLDLDPEQPISSEDVSFAVFAPPEERMGRVDVVVILPGVPAGTEVWVILPPDLFARWRDAGGELEGGSVEGERVLADPGATETVIRDLPLAPEEEAEVTLHVEAPVDEETDPFSMTVVERVNGKDVGGNTYYYAPPSAPPETPGILAQAWDFLTQNLVLGGALLCCGGVLIAAVLVGAVLVLRGRDQEPAPPSPVVAPGRTCPRCGAPLRAEAAFCPHCGSQVGGPVPPAPAAGRQCPRCGAAVREGAQFCPRCGTRL